MSNYKYSINQLTVLDLNISAIKIDCELSEDNMLQALTINEELSQYGYHLDMESIIKLAQTINKEYILEDLAAIFQIDTKLFYPNFPKQVMEMDMAQIRFHQLLHYASTYGREYFEHHEVLKGWLPDYNQEVVGEDKPQWLNTRLLRLVDEQDYYNVVYRKLIGSHKHLTKQQQELLTRILLDVDINTIMSTPITFKDKMLATSLCVFDSDLIKNTKLRILGHYCQHAGDVLKVVNYILIKHNFKLKTSQKRLLSKLLDQYDNLYNNLIMYSRYQKRNHGVLNYLDYTTYSRNQDNIRDVNKYRDGNGYSFNAQVEMLMANNQLKEALNLLANKPGELLRKVRWFLNKGYDQQSLLEFLSQYVEQFHVSSIITTLTFFANQKMLKEKTHAKAMCEIFYELLKLKLSTVKLSFNGKKLYYSPNSVDVEQSMVIPNPPFATTGTSEYGLAYKLPTVPRNKVSLWDKLRGKKHQPQQWWYRFFVYWNDEKRVDVDLHANGIDWDNKPIHIGWYGNYKANDIYYSGDITHSDATEFIDVLVGGGAKAVNLNINMYNYPDFTKLDTCYCGVELVSGENHQATNLDPKNFYFYSDLTSLKVKNIDYAIINQEHQVLRLVSSVDNLHAYAQGRRDTNGRLINPINSSYFNLKVYLELLSTTQNITWVKKPNQADYTFNIIANEDKEIGLLDNHFFIEEIEK